MGEVALLSSVALELLLADSVSSSSRTSEWSRRERSARTGDDISPCLPKTSSRSTRHVLWLNVGGRSVEDAPVASTAAGEASSRMASFRFSGRATSTGT